MNDLDLAIQKRVEVEVTKKLGPVAKRFVKLTRDCFALQADVLTLMDTPTTPARRAVEVKKPRAAISFTDGERGEVMRQLGMTIGQATIGEIANDSSLSSRLTGAILRDLVKAGKVIEGPKGKFRAAMDVSNAEGESDNVSND